MPGGHSQIKIPEPEDPIHADILGSPKVLEALGEGIEPEIVQYTQQVVAGTRYQLKLRVGEEFWHCDVVKPLPHTGDPPFIIEGTLEKGKTAEDPFNH
jgi:hypothetical protein